MMDVDWCRTKGQMEALKRKKLMLAFLRRWMRSRESRGEEGEEQLETMATPSGASVLLVFLLRDLRFEGDLNESQGRRFEAIKENNNLKLVLQARCRKYCLSWCRDAELGGSKLV
jgi:hypothetical protein